EQTNNGGVLTILRLLLSNGTSPKDRMFIKGPLEPLYSCSNPTARTMAGIANGTSERKSNKGRALGMRSCTQYAVGVTSTTAKMVAPKASSSDVMIVCERSGSAKIR